MKEDRKKPVGTPTPDENDRALADLAIKLGELDAAEGVFGEAMLDRELDNAGGGLDFSSSAFMTTCKECGFPYLKGTKCPQCAKPVEGHVVSTAALFTQHLGTKGKGNS